MIFQFSYNIILKLIKQTNNKEKNKIRYLQKSTKKSAWHLYDFLSKSEIYYDTYVESIIKYCTLYIELEHSDGLDDYEKRKNASSSEFSSNKIYLIFNLIIFLFAFVGLYVYVMKFYQIETLFIEKK